MEDSSVSLLFGVSGHRVLRSGDIQILSSSIENVLVGLQKVLPNSRIVLLTSLAQGVDRLVAKVALGLGISVLAPLPMDREEYEKDFGSEESLAEFRALLADHRLWWFVAERPEGLYSAMPEDRDRCYERVGAFIAQHAQLLIALWDGEGAYAEGPGTAQTVRFFLEGVPLHLSPHDRGLLDEPEVFEVVQVYTPRHGAIISVDAPVQPGTVSVLKCLDDRLRRPAAGEEIPALQAVGEVVGGLLTSLDRYNADARRLAISSDELIRAGMGSLLLDAADSSSSIPVSADLTGLAHAYAVADRLALQYQTPTHRTEGWLFLMGALGYLAFTAYTELWHSWLPLAVYIVVLTSLVWVWLVVPKHGKKDRYQDYRALAEGLRVQFYWSFTGIREFAADHYFSAHRTELDWIRNALRNLRLLVRPPPELSREEQVERLILARDVWISSQIAYFEDGIHHRERSVRRSSRLKNGLFFFALAVVVMLLPVFHFFNDESFGYHLAVFAAGALPATGAAYAGYCEIRAFEQEVRQYRETLGFYRRARAQLDVALASGSLDRCRSILFELGRKALAENGKWVGLHRQRCLGTGVGA